MIKHIVAATMLIGVSVQPSAAVSRFTSQQAALLQDGLVVTADEFIAPGYQALADAMGSLAGSLETYCADGSGLEKAKGHFADGFLAWQRISIIQVGPIMDGQGPMRFQLWPDPKRFSQRAVRRAIRAKDPALLEEGGLNKQSIALINQTALEAILYGELVPGSYGCSLAKSIAQHQADLALALTESWTAGSSFRSIYDSAATGNEHYDDVDALIREMVAGAIVYSDRLRKFKIQRGLGEATGTERPERLEARKSGLSLRSIEAGFRALSELYEVPGGFFDVTPDLNGSMDYFMLGQTALNVADTLTQEKRSLAEIAETDPEATAKLRGYGELILLHEDYLKTGLPQSIGLTSGFTSADGD